MMCARKGTGAAASDMRLAGSWADWLIADFTKLCSGLRPIAMEYLEAGKFTGEVRGDLLEEFLASPAGRTKERLPSLAVLVGWAAATGSERTRRFLMAFVEELWRRNFTALYKGQPRDPIVEVLERLLYGPDEDEDEEEEVGGVTRNGAAKD